MTRLTDGERLVKLETQVGQVLQGITEIKEDGKEFRDRLDLLLPTFATHEDLKVIELRLSKDIKEAKRLGLIKTIVTSVVTAVIVGIIMFEVGRFFK